MAINLLQLKAFCAVMQDPNYSVTKTAERIYIDYTAISRHITSLEDDLGFKLFDRTQYKRLKPTKEGQKFYDEVIVKYQGLDSLLKNYSKEMEKEKKNQINIAGLDAIFTRILPSIKKFKDQNPEANVSLFNTPIEEAFTLLKENKVDLIIYPRDIDDDCPIEMDKMEMRKFNIYWVLYKGHPLENKNEKDITQDEMASYPFGVISKAVYSKSFKKFIDSYELKVPLNIESGGIEFLKALVKNEMCITQLDDSFMNELDKKILC